MSSARYRHVLKGDHVSRKHLRFPGAFQWVNNKNPHLQGRGDRAPDDPTPLSGLLRRQTALPAIFVE